MEKALSRGSYSLYRKSIRLEISSRKSWGLRFIEVLRNIPEIGRPRVRWIKGPRTGTRHGMLSAKSAPHDRFYYFVHRLMLLNQILPAGRLPSSLGSYLVDGARSYFWIILAALPMTVNQLHWAAMESPKP